MGVPPRGRSHFNNWREGKGTEGAGGNASALWLPWRGFSKPPERGNASKNTFNENDFH